MTNTATLCFVLVLILGTVSCSAPPQAVPAPTNPANQDSFEFSDGEISVDQNEVEMEPSELEPGPDNIVLGDQVVPDIEVCEGCPLPGDYLIRYFPPRFTCEGVLSDQGEEAHPDDIITIGIIENGQSLIIDGFSPNDSIQVDIISGITNFVHYAGTKVVEGIELTYGLSFQSEIDTTSPKDILTGQITNEQKVQGYICKAKTAFEGTYLGMNELGP